MAPSASAPAPSGNHTPWVKPRYIPGGPGGPGPQNPAITVSAALNSSNPAAYIAVSVDQCYCSGWYDYKGSDSMQMFATVMGYICFATCGFILLLNVYLFNAKGKKAVAWEVMYVMTIVFTFYGFQIWLPFSSPVMVFLDTGNFVVALRYGQWLFATPVLLVLVADMMGQHTSYSHDDIYMVVADVCSVTIFLFGCLTRNIAVKIITYGFALAGFMYLFWLAWKCFMKLYKDAPTPALKSMVKLIIVVFFVGWNMHTVFSTTGPEMGMFLNAVDTEIAAVFSDMVAKCTFCLLATIFRYKSAMYFEKHGETEKKLEASDDSAAVVSATEKAALGPVDEGPILNHGVVILAVPDPAVVEYFTQQFEALPGPIELIPAMGADNVLMLVQTAMRQGSLDCVLLHPSFLQDRSQTSLAVRIKMMGQRVCAFGFSESEGPDAGWMLDGWLERPMHAGIDPQELMELLANMQSMQKLKPRRKSVFGMSDMSNSGYGDSKMMQQGSIRNSSLIGNPMMGQSSFMDPMMMQSQMQGSLRNSGLIGVQNSMGDAMMMSPDGMHNAGSMMAAAANPLYGSAASPLGSGVGNASMVRQAPSVAAGPSDAEMMRQMMFEINRLKGELGEQ